MYVFFRRMLFVCVALLAGATQSLVAGPDSVPPSLPDGFFNEHTVLFARVDLNAVNIGHMQQGIRAILPIVSATQEKDEPGIVNMMRVLRVLSENPQLLEQIKKRNPGHPVILAESVAVSLLAADFSEIFVLGQMEKQELESLDLYLLLPRGDQQQLPEAAVKAFGSFGMSVKTAGRWFVASREENLPSSGDGFGLEEVVFFDAIRSNPDHDVMVSIVPPQESRKAAKDVAEKAINDSSGAFMVAPFLEVLMAEWYYASLHLGEQPVLRVSAHLADEATPKSLVANYKSILNKTVASEADTKEQEIVFGFLKKVLPEADGKFLTLNLDQPKLALAMQTMVDEAYAKEEARKKKEAGSN